jgi:predicted Zn-dependent peptidase
VLRLRKLVAAAALAAASFVPVALPAQPVTAPARTLSAIRIHSEVLPSGLRLIVAETPPIPGREPRAYVTTYVLHGTMQEEVPGLAHFIEHVVANSPERVPSPLPPTGVQPLGSNALARPYYTSYYRLVPLSMLPHIIPNRLARAGAVKRDVDVVTRERVRVIDELERQRTTFFAAYKPLTMLSLGLPPALSGEVANVREVTPEALLTLADRTNRPENSVLVVIGDVRADAIRAMVRSAEAERLAARTGVRPRVPGPALRPLRFGQSRVLPGENPGERHLVGLAWPKPRFGARDQLPLLVVDHLLLGGWGDPSAPTRSATSPLALQFKRLLGAEDVHDGRTDRWTAPALVDTGEGINAVVFGTARPSDPAAIRAAAGAALSEIGRTGMTDRDIGRAKTELASFYEQWLLEPTYRILGDHLMVYLATGRDPRQALRLPQEIRRLQPSAIRAAFERYYRRVSPNVVVLPAKAASPGAAQP